MQYYRGANFIDKRLILPFFLMQTAVNHSPMGQNRSKTLIIKLYRDIRKILTPTVHKLNNAAHILTRTTVSLLGLTDNDSLYLLLTNIVSQKLKKGRR